jgi:hypothetical protein
MAMNKNSGWDFEEIDASEVTGVARGRKSNVDPALIDALRGLSAGKAIRIPSQRLDPKADNYRNEKARISAMLRTAMKAAGHDSFSIVFSPEGVPQIKVK